MRVVTFPWGECTTRSTPAALYITLYVRVDTSYRAWRVRATWTRQYSHNVRHRLACFCNFHLAGQENAVPSDHPEDPKIKIRTHNVLCTTTRHDFLLHLLLGRCPAVLLATLHC